MGVFLICENREIKDPRKHEVMFYDIRDIQSQDIAKGQLLRK
jgi:hypothetical protein